MPSEVARENDSISVLGAGSWGTALALQLSDNNHNVILWGRDEALLEKITQSHRNSVYLPDCELPRNLRTQSDLATTISASRIVVVAVPSAALKKISEKTAAEIGARHEGVILATKGIEPLSAKLAYEVVDEALGNKIPAAFLSGPSFADEVSRRLPTAVTIASKNDAFARKSAALFHNKTFRVYTNDDVIGTVAAGALKNIIAVAVGISDGLGFGLNARAALITRGLEEMRRLVKAMGGKNETLNGLAGIGDLVLTCTGDQSRNRRFGLLIAEGYSSKQISKKVTQTTEGVNSALAAQQLAQRYHVEMPICEQVNNVISGRIKAPQAVEKLLGRTRKSET